MGRQRLAGTPAAGTGGVYDLSVTATNGVGTAAVQGFVLTIDQPPAITSVSSATFTTGQAGSFGVTTTGWPLPSLTESGALPSGVTFHDNGDGTGTLSGRRLPARAGSTRSRLPRRTVSARTRCRPSPSRSTSRRDHEQPAHDLRGRDAGQLQCDVDGAIPRRRSTDAGPWRTGVTFHDNGDGTGTIAGTATTGTGGVYDSTLTAQATGSVRTRCNRSL